MRTAPNFSKRATAPAPVSPRGLLTTFLERTYHEQYDSPRPFRERPRRSGAAGVGRTCPRPRRRRWSAGRRRTPTSLGCARRIATARGGPSQGSPGVPRKHPGASRRSISLVREGKGKRGKGDARRPKIEVTGRRSVVYPPSPGLDPGFGRQSVRRTPDLIRGKTDGCLTSESRIARLRGLWMGVLRLTAE